MHCVIRDHTGFLACLMASFVQSGFLSNEVWKTCMVTTHVVSQKKSKDHFGLEGDEESTMLEDSVSPKK